MTDKKNLRSEAYKLIKNKIIFLDLKPGDKIFEDELVNSFKMSRTPVREALLLLENEGLVKCDDRLGFIVRKLSSKEVEEYFSLRKAIEIVLLPMIIERITPTEIKELKRNIRGMEYYVEKKVFHRIVKCDFEFHEILYKSAKSAIFFETISRLIYKFNWLCAIALKASGGSKGCLNDHKKIVQAVVNRDGNELKKLITSHIQHGRESALITGLFF